MYMTLNLSIFQPKVDGNVKGEVPKQEEKNLSEAPKHAQQMPLQVAKQPKQIPSPQVSNKTPKREFRKRQPKAKKRRINVFNPVDSSNETSNSELLSSSNVGGLLQPAHPDLKVSKSKFRTAKGLTSFYHVKPYNRFKHIKRNHQAVNNKNQIRCVSLKIKAE